MIACGLLILLGIMDRAMALALLLVGEENSSYWQLRIIGEYSLYPDQKPIVKAAELVSQTSGIGTTQCHHPAPALS